MCFSVSLNGFCSPIIYYLEEVSESSRECSTSSVVLALHISQFVYPSVCLLYMSSFKVHVLALNKVLLLLNYHTNPVHHV